jgi:hypothetical protein
MKHLLTGVAIAAALAIAAPAWAQAPAPAPSNEPAANAPAPAEAGAPKAGAPAKPMAMKQRHKRVMHHRGRVAMRRHGKVGPGDAMTEQLNREELARIQGGGAPAPGGMPMPPEPNAGAGQGGPRASGH